MTQQSQHEIMLQLDVVEVVTNKQKVWAAVKKSTSEEGATSYFPYAVWVADDEEKLNDPSTRRTQNSSIETLGIAIRMFFLGKASFVLDSGLPFTLNELIECKDDAAILELIQSKS